MNYLFLASFGEVMTYIGYILIAILILLFMITVHELGHYIAGKIFGFEIEEFAIGFGPKIFKKKKRTERFFQSVLFRSVDFARLLAKTRTTITQKPLTIKNRGND